MHFEWVLIICSILLNIIVIFYLLKEKDVEKTQTNEDVDNLYQSVELFISSVEKENDALYQKFVQYNRMKEQSMEERIRILEAKLQVMETNDTVIEQPIEQEDEVTNPDSSSNGEEQNEKVSKLSKQGFSPKQIAKLLQLEVGVVELIINMTRKKAIKNDEVI